MKKSFCILLSAMLCLWLPGCWSRKEPKTLALINSVLYDLGDTGGYEVTIEVINPSAGGGVQAKTNEKSPSITATSKGLTLAEAIRNISESLERTIFGGHNKVRFFSERFAREDITAAMDFLLRDRLTDENPPVVVVRHDDPKQMYSCLIGLSDMVGDYFESVSETQPDTTSKSVFVKTLDFIKDHYDEGKQPVAGVVEVVECQSKPSQNTPTDSKGAQGSEGTPDGGDKKYRIVCKGLAAFKDGKLAGYMDETEARAYNFVANNITTAVVSIMADNHQTVVIVYHPKTRIKTEIADGKTTVDVKITTRMSIVEADGALDITQMEPLKAIEADFNRQLAGEITAAIQKAQNDFQSDIFGFGRFVHRQHPKQWEEIKENWDDHFAKAAINVSVESAADRSGGIKQPFKLEAAQ